MENDVIDSKKYARFQTSTWPSIDVGCSLIPKCELRVKLNLINSIEVISRKVVTLALIIHAEGAR